MFEEDALLKQHFIDTQKLTEQQISAVIDYALDQGLTFQESLINLKSMSYADLGAALGELYRMPYYPLLGKPPSPFCKKMAPLKLADKWKIFPVGFDAQEDLLTIAISAPDQIKAFMRLEQKVFSHHRLAFSIASIVEIEKAITDFYRIDAPGAEAAPEVPDDFNIITIEETTWQGISLSDEGVHDDKRILLLENDVDKGKALRTILRREGYRKVTWVSSDQEAQRILKEGSTNKIVMSEAARHRTARWLHNATKGPDAPRISFYRSIAPLVLGQEVQYQLMSDAALSFVETVVRERLQQEPARLQAALDRVRYCRLLALRLQLSPVHVDGAILAAWLYDKEPFQRWWSCFSAPYHLETIIDEVERPSAKPGIETKILFLVLRLLESRRQEPGIFGDIQRLRLQLRQNGPAWIVDSMIETLLQLLRDEAFISRIDRPAARILIVDPELKPDAGLVLRLTNDGYEVAVAATAPEALQTLNSKQFDCLIAEVNLGDFDGVQLCKTIKKHSSFSSLVFLFAAATQDPKVMAECLRAGADDFLAKPVDWEVLSLKLHRVLSKKFGHDTKAGLTGTLSQMSFTDLVQILSTNLKSVRIAFSNENVKGEIFLNQGEVVHAQCGELSGESAFYRLMRNTEGEFEVVPWASFPPKTIDLSVMGLLMEGARLDDEAARGVKLE
jgi:DNA-binding response OmpR family regulator